MLDIPFYLYPGSILFRLDHYEEHALRSSLMSTWRLGILVVFTAAIAGILVWILVSILLESNNPFGFICYTQKKKRNALPRSF